MTDSQKLLTLCVLGGMGLVLFPQVLRVIGASFYALERALTVLQKVLLSGIGQVAEAGWLQFRKEMTRAVEGD